MADLASKDCDHVKGSSSSKSSEQGGNNEKKHSSKQLLLEAMKTLGSLEPAGLEESIEDAWDNLLVPELQQLLSSVIEATFQCAIKRIVRFGYTDHVAKWAISISGVYIGLKDTESNIVENALTFLKNHENEPEAERVHVIEDLQSLARNTMLEMVSAIRGVCLDLSVAEATWYLLIYDLNLSKLCSSKVVLTDDSQFKSRKENTWEKCTLSIEELSQFSNNLNDLSYQRNVRDRVLLLLQMKKINMEKEVSFWTKWANEIVMQATLRLTKDQKELKELRAERAKEEKMDKREDILANIKEQIKIAKAELMSVEEEHKVLKKTMNDNKMELQVACDKLKHAKIKGQEISEKKIKDLEKMNSTLEHDLRKMKNGKERIGQDLKKEQAFLKQEEAKISEIEKGKETLIKLAATLRSEREDTIAAVKLTEELAKRQAEDYKKKFKEEMEKVEAQISQLKMKAEMEKISELRRSMSLSLSNTSEGLSGSNSLKRQNKYEYECVMCLNDVRTVVFLPCSHQVLCVNCSELHEKQGLNECPTCRTQITKRIATILYKP